MDKAPRLNMAALSASQQVEARIIQRSLDEMLEQVNSLSSTIQLFAHCLTLRNAHKEPPPLPMPKPPQDIEYLRKFFQELRVEQDEWRKKYDAYRRSVSLIDNWRRMACRDGVMSVYHFWQAMEIAKETVQRCPAIKANYDSSVAREATQMMKRDFRGRDSMRQAIAHWAELHRSEKESKKNTLTGPFEDGVIKLGSDAVVFSSQNIINDYFFQTMHRGNSHELEMTHATGERLKLIMERFFEAFANALDLRDLRGS